MITKKTERTECKYKCDECKFKTNDKNDYRRHLLTLKHKKITKKTEKTEHNETTFKCNCGREYKYKSGYSRHKKVCEHKVEEKQEEETNEKVDYKEMFIQMLNQNKELQDLLITQQEEFMKQQKDLFIKQQEETNKKFENLVLHIRNTN
jgi:hypothetical protein